MDTDHSPPRTRWNIAGIAIAAFVVGLVAGGLGIAAAAEGKATAAVEAVPGDAVPVPPPFFAGRPGPFPFPGAGPESWAISKRFGFPGFGFGPGFGGPGIHSEVTIENPEGKYQTTATQLGKVVAVSPTSITIESDDGYKRTYAVTEETLVTAGRDGIANLKNGDSVSLLATVDGDKARAVQIWDAGAMKLAAVGAATKEKAGD
jgi:hypothetical protein